MTAIVIGATGGVGQALASEIAESGGALLLVARDADKLAELVAALRARKHGGITTLVADAARVEDFAGRLRASCDGIAVIEALFCPIGASSFDDAGTQPFSDRARLIDVNFAAVVAAVEVVLPRMQQANRGAIVGFSSVAAVRGRSANVIYAAAKRALECYFESLRHRLAVTGIAATVYRLGYIDTQQNIGKKLLFPQVSPHSVARKVLATMNKGGLIEFPWFWRLITLLVRAIPWGIYKRMQF